MSVNELVEQWLFEYASRHCLHAVLNGNKIVLHCNNRRIPVALMNSIHGDW